METLIEQLKERGFRTLASGGDIYTRVNDRDWETVQFIRGRVSASVTVVVVGELDRWFPGTVTVEEIEAFIARARRVIAEWDTMEISFGGE